MDRVQNRYGTDDYTRSVEGNCKGYQQDNNKISSVDRKAINEVLSGFWHQRVKTADRVLRWCTNVLVI